MDLSSHNSISDYITLSYVPLPALSSLFVLFVCFVQSSHMQVLVLVKIVTFPSPTRKTFPDRSFKQAQFHCRSHNSRSPRTPSSNKQDPEPMCTRYRTLVVIQLLTARHVICRASTPRCHPCFLSGNSTPVHHAHGPHPYRHRHKTTSCSPQVVQ